MSAFGHCMVAGGEPRPYGAVHVGGADHVAELDNGGDKVTLSDLRSTTWEDGAAKKFIFKSQNYLNETLVDTVDGEAEREPDKVAVSLTEPAAKKFDLEAAMVFPTDHMR